MIKILICCGGGFSSSAMVSRVQKEIEEKGLKDQMMIDFSPFTISHERVNEFDVVMCCPHLKHQIKAYNDRYIKNSIPLYILPPRMYGTMYVEEIYEDALDILEGFKKNPQNPFYFEGEENILRVQRLCSYRKAHKK